MPAVDRERPPLTELPHGASAVDALLDAPCRCHAEPNHGASSGAPAQRPHAERFLDPQLPMRTFRPLVQHVRGRLADHPDRFAQWEQLCDEDRVSAHTADAWVAEASRWLRDPVLGLNALSTLKRGAADVVELAAECAPTLAEALETITRYTRLVYEGADFHLHVRGDIAALALGYTLQVSHITSDYVLGLWVHALRRWLAPDVQLAPWFADGTARRAATYETAFAPFPVRFGTRVDAIVFPSRLLDLPLRDSDRVRHRVLARFAENLVQRQPQGGSLVEQVRRMLTAVVTTGENVNDVAHKLGMSKRSLSRRLRLEGHSFSELLDDVRRERALHLVERSALPSHRISRILGYGSTATFCRAFARWQGDSPLQHRRLRLQH